MYTADPDPYCYPNGRILKNKAGHKSRQALEEFETAMTFARAEEPLPSGRFSVRHYCAVHHHLFQDVYVWAGQYRSVRLAKGTSNFCYPEFIAAEMRRVFDELKMANNLRSLTSQDFASGAAHFLAELNAIHPFREGNGRTQNTFLTMLADSAGHPVDLDRLKPKSLLKAMVASFHANETALAKVIFDLISHPVGR